MKFQKQVYQLTCDVTIYKTHRPRTRGVFKYLLPLGGKIFPPPPTNIHPTIQTSIKFPTRALYELITKKIYRQIHAVFNKYNNFLKVYHLKIL